jgi:hypothetical protein
MAGKRPSLNPAHREIAKTYIHRMTALASVKLPLYKDFENRPRVARPPVAHGHGGAARFWNARTGKNAAVAPAARRPVKIKIKIN